MLKITTAFVATALALGTPTWVQAQTAGVPEAAYEAGRTIISNQQRIVTPGGVQSVEQVSLGGMDQWISIRGADRDNPVLIYVHGGPGATELGRAWPYQSGWEDWFTVVQWDQRGAGKTLRSNGDAASRPTLTRERMGEDLVELIALVRERLGQRQVVLLGHSWGHVIAMDAALARPDWISAYVAVGPLIDLTGNEAAGYARVLAAARRAGNAEAIEELEALAPYPGPGPFDLGRLGVQRKWVMRLGGLAAYRDNADFYFQAARLSPDYDLADRQAIDAGGLPSVQALLPGLLDRPAATPTETPFAVFGFLGRHDMTTPPETTQAWLDRLDAPTKRTVWFEHSAHLAPHEEPGRFLVALVSEVRPIACQSAGC